MAVQRAANKYLKLRRRDRRVEFSANGNFFVVRDNPIKRIAFNPTAPN